MKDGTVLWARALLGANIRDYSFAFRAVAQTQLDDDDDDQDDDYNALRKRNNDNSNRNTTTTGGVVVLAFIQG